MNFYHWLSEPDTATFRNKKNGNKKQNKAKKQRTVQNAGGVNRNHVLEIALIHHKKKLPEHRSAPGVW